jgi:hypothetical protein
LFMVRKELQFAVWVFIESSHSFPCAGDLSMQL